MAPMLFGMQAGSLAGMLSQYALGQYDLPLPLAGPPRLAFIAANIDAFAADWQLPTSDLRFALALREVAHAAERTVPWVRERLVRLSSEFVSGYELRPELLEEQFGGLGDLGALGPDLFSLDPQEMESRLGGLGDADPNALLDGMRTEAQQPILDQLVRFGAVLEGYADVVVELVGAPLIPELTRIEEALRRHRVERGRVAAFVERMLGLEIDREHYEAGAAFCRGVTERAGIEGLNRLWEREAMVPTAAELEAPGLWLARIELAD
jgi:putative hydrolase